MPSSQNHESRASAFRESQPQNPLRSLCLVPLFLRTFLVFSQISSVEVAFRVSRVSVERESARRGRRRPTTSETSKKLFPFPCFIAPPRSAPSSSPVPQSRFGEAEGHHSRAIAPGKLGTAARTCKPGVAEPFEKQRKSPRRTPKTSSTFTLASSNEILTRPLPDHCLFRLFRSAVCLQR